MRISVSPNRVKPPRKPRGAQRWILAELRAADPETPLSTSKIAKRVAKASGKKFHPNSIYVALRILVKKGAVRAIRDGHAKAYQLASLRTSSSTTSPKVRAAARKPAAPEMARAQPQPTLPLQPGSEPATQHKLAVGELLILHVGETHVETATNVHGRMVVERHPRLKRVA
jgi:hypothetical protein